MWEYKREGRRNEGGRLDREWQLGDTKFKKEEESKISQVLCLGKNRRIKKLKF